MTVYELSGALVGLAGACSNNGNTPEADRVVREALAFQAARPDAAEEELQPWLKRILKVKFTISPGCASCASPCGNTSTLPMEGIASADGPVNALKKEILDTLALCAARLGDKLPIEAAYQGLLYVQSVDETDLFVEELAELQKLLPAD